MDYSADARALQTRFDAERLADATARLAHPRLTDGDRAVLARADMFFLATVDGQGRPTCSYKGGEPGFLHPLDDATLAFPSYDGNGMFLSLGNVSATGEVGLLLIDFERQSRMRIHGTASLHPPDPKFPEAQLMVHVAIREVFPNCGRYIHRYTLAERSAFVPKPGVKTPVPKWKRADWAKDALPAHDPAREPE